MREREDRMESRECVNQQVLQPEVQRSSVPLAYPHVTISLVKDRDKREGRHDLGQRKNVCTDNLHNCLYNYLLLFICLLVARHVLIL